LIRGALVVAGAVYLYDRSTRRLGDSGPRPLETVAERLRGAGIVSPRPGVRDAAVAFGDRQWFVGLPTTRKLRRAVPVPPSSEFTGFRFPPEVIVLAVRWYLRFGLSYRDVEELLTERGVEVDHVTI
jgi:hypothetical protein